MLVDAMVGWVERAQEPVLFVTFNYDTMLERAIAQELTYSFGDMNSYVARNDVKVFKVHGSVDWGHRGNANFGRDGMPGVIEHAWQLDIPGDYQIKRDWNVSQGSEFWVPALAVPVRTKSSFECLKEHLDKLWELLPAVERVLVIGWAGMEDHFLAMLHERLRTEQKAVVVACGSTEASRETFARMARWPDGRTMSVRGGPATWQQDLKFSELFATDDFRDFVSRV